MLQRSSHSLISVFVVTCNLLFLSSFPTIVEGFNNATERKAARCPNNCEPNGKCLWSEEADSKPLRCQCDEGFAGADCSFPYEACPDGFTRCYDGAKCVRGLSNKDPNDVDGRDDQNYVCDCEAMGNNPSEFVIEQCENPVDEVCEIGVNMSHYAFCTNAGKCWKMVEPGQTHPGCDCPKEFEGRHCQYRKGTAPPSELLLVWNQDPDEIEEPIDDIANEPAKILIWIIVASFSVLLALGAFVCCVYARLKHVSDKRHEQSITRIGVISLRDISSDSKDEEKFDDIVLGNYSDDESEEKFII